MKRPKKPTRSQKMGISKNGLNPDEYLIIKEGPDYLRIIHKETKKQQDIRW